MSSAERTGPVRDLSPGLEPDDVAGEASAHQQWSHWSVAVLAALSILCAVAVLLTTASGLGVSPDGVAYLSLADEFRVSGSPYAVLAPSPTHYAPLWSLLVGGVAVVTATDDLLAIGRWFNALLAAAVAPLAFLAVRRSPSAPVWWCLLAAALVASSFGLFRLSVRALTEPLFVVLLLGVLVVTEVAIRRRSRLVLISASVIAALLVAHVSRSCCVGPPRGRRTAMREQSSATSDRRCRSCGDHVDPDRAVVIGIIRNHDGVAPRYRRAGGSERVLRERRRGRPR